MKEKQLPLFEGKTDQYKCSRFLYIIQAALEYFVALLVADAYLAKVTSAIGMSDALTGVLSAFVSLGCGMQIVAVFLTRMKSVKHLVVAGSVINQLLFALVYLTPFLPQSWGIDRSVLLLVLLLVAHLVMNVVHSPKINWFMSLVDNHARGTFTAKKEIVSLIGGMLFSFGMGAAIDAFEAAGNQSGAFLTCALTLFALTVFHTLAILFVKEKPTEKSKSSVPLGKLVCNKNLIKVIIFSVLWHVVNYITVPFLGAYKVGNLGFTMTFISVLAAVSSLSRAALSLPIGRFADKHSFANAMILCFGIEMVALIACAFSSPATGKILFPIYMILHAISLAGINSGTINLVYDYVPCEGRVAALALQNSIAGVAGFLTTLAVSPFVTYVQNNGNTFLGLSLYAPQILAAVACLCSFGIILYLVLVIRKLHRESGDDKEIL